MPNLSRSRGVTLLEVMIAMAVTMIVVAGTVIAVRSQQKAYGEGQRLRGAQNAARRALLAVEASLPSAGIGMDGPLAFDLSGWTSGPCPSQMGACSRDSVSNSDELTFFARDLDYWTPQDSTQDPVGNAWMVNSVASGSLNLNAHPNDVFRQGQILAIVCSAGAPYGYATVSANTAVPPTVTADVFAMDVPIVAVDTNNPFKRQDAVYSCGASTDKPRAFLVNKYRFHVRPVSLGGTQYDPLLVLDRGLDLNGDNVVDQNDEQLISEGIESMQVGYLFANSAIPMAGASPGTPVTFAPDVVTSTANTSANRIGATTFPGTPSQPGESPYLASSFYQWADGTIARQSNQQANVVAVRITFLARSVASDVQSSVRGTSYFPVLNQNLQPTWVSGYATSLGGHDGYQRVVLETTVATPNLNTRAMPYF